MIDPSEALQETIVQLLENDAAVSAIVGDRVYDGVPEDAVKPYIHVAGFEVLPDKATCLDGAVITVPIHGWTEGPSSVGCKQLGKAIIAALDDQPITVAGHRVIVCELEQARYLDDPDPLTKHAAVFFRIVLEPV